MLRSQHSGAKIEECEVSRLKLPFLCRKLRLIDFLSPSPLLEPVGTKGYAYMLCSC